MQYCSPHASLLFHQHAVTAGNKSLLTTPQSHGTADEEPRPFHFPAYRQPILQALLQHGKVEHVLSQKGKLLAQFNPASHGGIETGQPPEWQLANEMAEIRNDDKTMQASSDHDPEDNANQLSVDMLKRMAESNVETGKLAVPDKDFLDRCNVPGVKYASHGNRFTVNWHENGISRHKYFPIKKYGLENAYRLAVEFREQKIREGIRVRRLAVADTDFMIRKRPENKGVYYDTRRKSWIAYWPSGQGKGKRDTRAFSVAEHGASKAFALAVLHREQQMREISRRKAQPGREA